MSMDEYAMSQQPANAIAPASWPHPALMYTDMPSQGKKGQQKVHLETFSLMRIFLKIRGLGQIVFSTSHACPGPDIRPPGSQATPRLIRPRYEPPMSIWFQYHLGDIGRDPVTL